MTFRSSTNTLPVTTIVWDLDDTLLDTTRWLIPIAKTPAFFQRIQQPLPLMEGAQENLEYLKARYRLLLLTYGHVPSQQQKVRSLGIGSYFTAMHFVDPEKNETKTERFLTIRNELSPSENFLSIGNRRSTDLRGAKKVGGWTCWFAHGEHRDEASEVPEDEPDFSVQQHSELITVCKL